MDFYSGLIYRVSVLYLSVYSYPSIIYCSYGISLLTSSRCYLQFQESQAGWLIGVNPPRKESQNLAQDKFTLEEPRRPFVPIDQGIPGY